MPSLARVLPLAAALMIGAGSAALAQQTPAAAPAQPAQDGGPQAIRSLNALEAARAQDQVRLEAGLRDSRDAAFAAYARALKDGMAPERARSQYLSDLDRVQAGYEQELEKLMAAYAARRAELVQATRPVQGQQQ